MLVILVFLPDHRFRYGLQAGRDLNALLPLLPPGVRQHVEVVRTQLGRVWQLHGRDEVGAEHLRGEHSVKPAAAGADLPAGGSFCPISYCCLISSQQHMQGDSIRSAQACLSEGASLPPLRSHVHITRLMQRQGKEAGRRGRPDGREVRSRAQIVEERLQRIHV